jgi:hypothetical protein
MFVFGNVNQEELDRLATACKTTLSAYNSCMVVNSEKSFSCANLELGVLACLAGKTCPKEHEKFDRCCKAAHSSATIEGRMRVYDEKAKCDEEVSAMRKCLKRRGVWPKLSQKSSTNSR